MYKQFVKRVLDIVLAIIGIVVFSIPMIIIAIIIKLDSHGPIFFKQYRLGKDKLGFNIIKFRTMCENAYEIGGIVESESDIRITRIGKILRRYSLDELPQFFNILIGDMSFVGPRPILDWEFEENNNHLHYELRYDVKPGLFCTVDVHNRNADRDLQFDMDSKYARNCSFLLDFKTSILIFKTVFTGKGVYKNEKD